MGFFCFRFFYWGGGCCLIYILVFFSFLFFLDTIVLYSVALWLQSQIKIAQYWIMLDIKETLQWSNRAVSVLWFYADSVKGLRLIYHVLYHTMQIPKYTNSSVSDTGSIEPLVYILQQFNNIFLWKFKVFFYLRTKLSTNKPSYLYVHLRGQVNKYQK